LQQVKCTVFSGYIFSQVVNALYSIGLNEYSMYTQHILVVLETIVACVPIYLQSCHEMRFILIVLTT
jgi:hypothetical protein